MAVGTVEFTPDAEQLSQAGIENSGLEGVSISLENLKETAAKWFPVIAVVFIAFILFIKK